MRERFKQASESWSEQRRLSLEDLEFLSGDQWPDDIKSARDLDKRPCLTINRLPQFLRQVTNEQRQNRPSIKVSPVDDNADVETAKVLQGIIRHVEYNSSADTAYDTAFYYSAASGLGFFRIITDYVSPTSFELEPLIKRVKNPFSVYPDPFFKEPDGCDMEYCFIVEPISKDEFKDMYPDAELSSMSDWKSIGDMNDGWCEEDATRLAEYFYKDYEEKDLVLLNTKEILEKSELPEELPLGIEIVKERKALIPVVRWIKTNGIEILEETTFPGSYIPIIPVIGDEIEIDGKRILSGVIRNAKDPQRMYNYWASSETEMIALAPRAPFIGVEGQFEGHENEWKTANIKNYAFLQYKPKTIGGQLAPPPARNIFEAPTQSITQARMQTSDDLKATTGIYDASLGARSNENSGIAIQRRNVQAQTANFHFMDNLSRSLRHAGRILVEIIPQIYDTERAIRIIGEDETEDVVYINQVFEKNGKTQLYDLSRGKYDVTISNGPSYATKRQEAVESMLALSQANPQITQIAGDLMVKNMDWPGADEIAERLKKTIPPNLLEQEGGGESQEIPPQVQAQMQQMNQMVEQLTNELNHKNEIINQKQVELSFKQAELESREKIEFAKIEAGLKEAWVKTASQEAIAALKAEVDQINRHIESLGFEKERSLDVGITDFSSGQNINPTGGFSPGLPVE